MLEDTLLVVFISICTALLSEGILYLLVYRTENYKRLKSTIDRQSKKLEKKKENAGGTQKKKIEKQEEMLQTASKDLSMVKMKSMMVLSFTFMALMGMLNSIFDGHVVARLPFKPFPFLQGISRRNLMGTDPTDCSFIFLYILCTMSLRETIQKLLGFQPTRAASKLSSGMFSPPPSK